MQSTEFQEQISSCRLNRRTFIKGQLLALGVLALPLPVLALPAHQAKERALSFHNTHTGESLKNAVYWIDGGYVGETLEDINFILRDFRQNEIKPIDPRLLDQLFAIRRTLEVKKPIHIISGYRSPATNRMLSQQGGGVAKRSFHMDGKAADIRLPGCDLKILKKAALSLKRGGVGYYPKSDFVHIDTGPVRSW